MKKLKKNKWLMWLMKKLKKNKWLMWLMKKLKKTHKDNFLFLSGWQFYSL